MHPNGRIVDVVHCRPSASIFLNFMTVSDAGSEQPAGISPFNK
jgi:hypothetical protein